MGEGVGLPFAVTDDDLIRFYGAFSDGELSVLYDVAVRARNWSECELINVEWDRRRRADTTTPEDCSPGVSS